uniref:Methanethiol oxidase n=1 Tax=Arcella intermedia TaxID=1963864 RepID=A0A6B2LDB8_9EUKA
MAVLDFDCRSPTYGDFVTVKDVLGPSAVNNEPHHGAFNIHKDRFFSGGLLSLLKSTGQNEEIFAWKVEDPRRPEQLHLGNLTGNPRRTGVPDEFLALRDGGYFVSMMGDSQGNSPGGVLYISPEWYVEEFPSEHHLPKDDCFNPHGIAVDETAGILVTGDFVTPSSILTGGTPHFCDSIRIWDLAEMKIRKTIHLEQAVGIMNVNFVPGDPELRYIAAVPFDAFGTDVSLYVMDPEGNLHSTFHVTPYLIGPGGHCYSRINRLVPE